MARTGRPAGGMEPNHVLTLQQKTEETGAQSMARKLLQPTLKNAAAASAFTEKMMGNSLELPGIGDYADHIHAVTHDAAGGDIQMARKVLAAQAITLDSMFAEFARRAALNMGVHINAAERYGRLAIRAQSNCRTTLEALAKLHLPREQTVRNVHVNEGGQAVVADHFHIHPKGYQNEKSDKQSHATSTFSGSSEMSSSNQKRESVPISGCQGKKEVPHARRSESGSPPGQ